MGSLAWDGPSGGALLDRLTKAIDGGDTGWVPRSELRRLLERLTPVQPATPSSPERIDHH